MNTLLSLTFNDGSKATHTGYAQECAAILDDLSGIQSDKNMHALSVSKYIKRLEREHVWKFLDNTHISCVSQHMLETKVGAESRFWVDKTDFERESTQMNLFPKETMVHFKDKPVKERKPVVTHVFGDSTHKQINVHLLNYTDCTCVETGISYAVKLPSIRGMHMSTLHPLSFYKNVEELVKSYINKGIALENELDTQVLAGCIITALRHHKLLRSNDYISANLCLQKALPKLLSEFLRFFVYTKSTNQMPSLRLIPEALYDVGHVPAHMTREECFADRIGVMLVNYLKVCRGENEGYTRIAGASFERRIKDTVRVYGGNLSIERRQTNKLQELAYDLLEKLEHEFPEGYTTFIEYLEEQIDALAFLGKEKRKQIALEIKNKFKDQKTATELGRLFVTVNMETVEHNISTNLFDTPKVEAETQPIKRFNLLSKIKV